MKKAKSKIAIGITLLVFSIVMLILSIVGLISSVMGLELSKGLWLVFLTLCLFSYSIHLIVVGKGEKEEAEKLSVSSSSVNNFAINPQIQPMQPRPMAPMQPIISQAPQSVPQNVPSTIKCPNCGGNIAVNATDPTISCPGCGKMYKNPHVR